MRDPNDISDASLLAFIESTDCLLDTSDKEYPPPDTLAARLRTRNRQTKQLTGNTAVAILPAMNTYHVEVGLPGWFRKPMGAFRPRYGSHSRSEAASDRYGRVNLPTFINWANCNIIEVYAEGQKVVKLLVRMKYDCKRDLCLVIGSDGFVRTVWTNLVTDNHRTLVRSRYCSPTI